MEKKKNQISLVDLISLQCLWICQTVYETVMSVFEWRSSSKKTSAAERSKTFHEKRHFIQLNTTKPKRSGDKPVCYMDVIEFESSQEEEIRIRKRSSDVTTNKTFLKYHPYHRSHSDNDLQRFYCSSLRF